MEIACSIIRGGTSKGVYVLEKNIPAKGPERDRVLLRLMGSPDVRQIDGLGGATSVTSKVAIIKKSEREDADIDYTFAQVGIDKPIVSYAGNCGNISSGVGPFSIESGLVEPREGITEVRVYNTNTRKVICINVKVQNGKVVYEGDYAIAGVPGTAAPIRLTFENPGGAVTGKLLPTGNPVDALSVPGIGTIPASFVDASNPLVFINAADIDLKGTELPGEINGDPLLLERLESIRAAAALKLGFIDCAKESATRSPGVPKLTLVAPATTYRCVDGTVIDESQIDLVGRMMSMQKAHETYALTGAACTACAAAIPGTLVNQIIKNKNGKKEIIIGHPGGAIEAGADFVINPDGSTDIKSVYCFRTARLLMQGTARI